MVKTTMISASNGDNNLKDVEGKSIFHQNFMIDGHDHSSHSIASQEFNGKKIIFNSLNLSNCLFMGMEKLGT